MPFLQDFIHKLEEGGGIKYLRLALAGLAVLLLLVGYNIRAFRNMSNLESMDSAQLARNIAEGRGYTTQFIRPFSIYLVKETNIERAQENPKGDVLGNIAELRGGHPDIANPPVYPYVLAGLMKVLPFQFEIGGSKPFWTPGGRFLRYQPDFLISLFNQVLFLAVVWLVFRLAAKLFDPTVAWISALVLLCAEIFWRFSVSGLSTMLLLLIFVGLVWLLVLLEEDGREPKRGPSWPLLLGAGIGLLVGLGALTRYSFMWILVPVLGFIIICGGRRRAPVALIVVAIAGCMVGGWMYRNFNISGAPFGTASYVLMENTPLFPEFRLQRSLEPNFSAFIRGSVNMFWHKLLVNLGPVLEEDLPTLGGSWISAFFLVGLMVGFRNPATNRLRYFLLGCLVIFIFAQALGRTYLSELSPEINSEKMVILAAPLVLVFGVSFFFLLLEQMPLPLVELRYLVIGAFVIIGCLPMIFVYLPPRPFPIAYPPYDPPNIQIISKWLNKDELIMSDVPWAVAWYGNRQSVWLTLRATPDPEDPQVHEDFFTINDFLKPIHALYLTPVTIDRHFISEMFRVGDYNWGAFLLESFVQKRVPRAFPLSYTHELQYQPPLAPKPQELKDRIALLDQQVTNLATVARSLLQDPALAEKLAESEKTAAMLQKVILMAEGEDFPLGSAPVRDMANLEQLILRGQLVLADRPRWIK